MDISDKDIITILREEASPALGCTEPVACALACARCREELGKMPEKIEVAVSGNIFKNGMGVGIPGTGMTGLPIAAALGAVCGKTAYGLEVLKDVSVGDNLAKAKDLVERGAVKIFIAADASDKLYADAVVYKGKDKVRTLIVHSHTNITLVEKNGETIFSNPYRAEGDGGKQRPELSMRRIWKFIREVDVEDIAFLMEGVEMNKAISDEGLKHSYGLQIGKTIKKNIEKGFLKDDFINQALLRATSASDARMDGCEKPVMTNSGSGNQGITVYMPVIVLAEHLDAPREKLLRALALSNLVAAHIHYYTGHLSALCGILMAASGSSAAMTYLLGGEYEQVVAAVKIMASNLTGMMCDGAKQGCALKVYSGVSAAVSSALMAMEWTVARNDGIVDGDIEKTIKNIGLIAKEGMEKTDASILDIMCRKQI